jgi:Zn-dependent protease
MNDSIFIFQIIILIMSVVIHELSHGYTAELLGDPTPRLQGRLTLNPLRHLELFGSFLVPVLTSLTGFTFGWAKPIEWNPYNVKNKRVGEILISIAGPASNMLVATVFGLIVRIFGDTLPTSFIQISVYVILINIVLAVFNMIPLPPLDGSKVLFSLLPPSMNNVRVTLERYSIFFFLILIFVLWRFVEPIIPYIFKVITGVTI